MFKIGLHGLGLQNLDDQCDLSGEHYFLKQFLTRSGPKPIILDVGANEGQYLQAVKSKSVQAEMHCFEPHPGTFQRLQQTASAYTDVKLNNLGCGALGAPAELFDYPGEGSQHASVHTGVLQHVHGAKPVAVSINITTLDEYCEQNAIQRIDLLKIDTEGHEYAVLQGARSLIDRGCISAIHFEFNEMNTYSRVFFRDFVALLPQFDFFRMLPDGLIALGPYRADLFELFAYQNVVALQRAGTRPDIAT